MTDATKLADEIEALLEPYRRPDSSSADAFALRSHMLAHVDAIVAALRERDALAAQLAAYKAMAGDLAEHCRLLRSKLSEPCEVDATLSRYEAMEDQADG